ncbi:Ig-like domain-containing protein [Pseudoruegeria sp. HB172150]|uniref:Ig-like domain-containing protein n=1 Tax=Pseudoruegeria sp. HB172150 TaxID=2721164 RepID=UPI0015545533|nr:Ig-like domain-containing protein [Pseudoruegeria sp. HB172150]
MNNSDDFAAGELSPLWDVVAPTGTSVVLGTNATDAYLELVTPDGDHDVWDANNGVRAMQDASDTDFQIETRFLTTPTEKFQLQGLLVEQDEDNWLRFDTYSDGNNLYAFAAITVDGDSTSAFKVAIPEGTAPYLRLTRTGDTWTFEYSQDGLTWTTAGSFDHALTVSQTGVFAGNTGNASGYTAQVDYFENSADPIVDEDGTIVPVDNAPDATDDAVTTEIDTALVIDPVTDLLVNDSDPEGSVLTLTSVTQPTNGTLTANLDGTYTYTPNTGFTGFDSFTYSIEDEAGGSSSATVTISILGPPIEIISDDFNTLELGSQWTFYGITGSATTETDGTNSWLEITSPPGEAVDAYRALTTPRVLQNVEDGDFQVAIHFLNEPQQAFQEHGLLLVEDDDTWFRFDVAHTRKGLVLIVGQVDGDSQNFPYRADIESGDAQYLRITRIGDSFDFEYSSDGETWILAISITSDMVPTQIGPFAGSAENKGNIPGFVSQFDWFESSTDPILNEDGEGTPVNNPPNAENDSLATGEGIQLVIDPATDLLGNDSDANGDTLTLISVTDPSHGTLTLNIDGTYTYSPTSGYVGPDSFTYTVSDGTSEGTATVNIAVGDFSNTAPVASDDAVAVSENGSATFDVLVNDTDVDGDTLSVSSLGTASNGTVTLNPDGTVTYTPNAGFVGADSFTYVVSDGSEQDTATVNITVNALPNTAPTAVDDSFDVAENGSATVNLLTNDSDADGDPLSMLSVGDAANGTVTLNPDGTVTYVPNAGFTGTDSFTYTVTDGEDNSTATATVTVEADTPPPTGSNLVSDDFSDGSLGGAWTLVGPTGTSAGLGTNSTDAYLELITGAGDNDVWNTNNSSRAMQATADTDFQIETRFLSTPTAKYQLQGLIVEQDSQNWLRFDTYSDGKKLYAFAAITTNGVSDRVFKVAIPEDGASYLRLTRSGDTWTFEYSADGSNWTAAGSFDYSLAVSQVGVFAGSAGAAPGFTAVVDYFENTADPIVDEDGVIVPVDNPPDAVDDALATDEDVALLVNPVSDLLNNDSDPEGGVLTLLEVTQPSHGSLTENGDGTYTYTPDAGFSGTDSFTYTISDGNSADTATATITVNAADTPPPTDTNLTSDDFSEGTLDAVWTVAGPATTSVSLGTNATDGYLELVTAGGIHDVWDTNMSARAMQATDDTDFQIETRFLTTPTQKYELQGLIVEEDSANWLRFDTYSDGSKLFAFAAITVDGVSERAFKVVIPQDGASYLRLTRDGDTWTFEYSADGENWTSAGSFDHAMTVTQTGVFAGNTGSTSGYTAQVDYFENTAEPIANEDGTIVPVEYPPDAVDDGLVTPTDTPFVIDPVTDLLANDSDANGDTLTITEITQPSNGTLTSNGDGTYTYAPNAGFEGADGFTYTISDGTNTDTATVSIAVGNPIDVWYGLEQSFGSPGEGQEWINILGNVAGDVETLTYSLNGGPERTLSVGADGIRLEYEGDFNIDISYSELDGSSVDDIVTITATYAGGVTVTRDVTIDYESGSSWDPNYSIDWSTVTDLQDVVQVVDGLWTFDDDGARPAELGYDRLLVLGDQTWDNYELTMTITTNDLQNEDPINGGGFAFGMLWDGHTDSRHGDIQPLSGWEPGAAFFYRDGRFRSHSYDEWTDVLAVSSKLDLAEDVTFNVIVRVEQTGIYDRLYSLKIWEVGTPEPTEWTLQGLETFSLDEAPATGGIYLNSHYYDITFGDLTVTEITGSDIIQGTEAADLLSAVDTGSANPGVGEIDVFTGNGGADVFVFGDADGVYYDDGNGATSGLEDYGFAWDFDSGTDQVQLHGSASDYVLTSDGAGLATGSTAIWLIGTGGEEDELIGILNGAQGLDLNSSDFVFADNLI